MTEKNVPHRAPAAAAPKTGGIAGNFVREQMAADLAGQRHGRVATRFPPEPNGYLHIGHAKAICVDFGLAREFGGTCNLRFDDTNPLTEDVEYVEAIQADIRWLGFEWSNLTYASDYFERLYDLAVKLIGKGRAYVDSLS
jgi:glutaminyl-tRNA synthetase